MRLNVADHRLVEQAIAQLASNPEQFAAVNELGHCLVLAGPGSGKTKTLTTAMARAIRDDLVAPGGVACITYNNECALELEDRLAKLGVESDDRIFIGTVHSFALSQVLSPYARFALPELAQPFRLGTVTEIDGALEAAYQLVINEGGNPKKRWEFAKTKRRRDVDRDHPDWRGKNPELADFIEAYEADLHGRGLIDFDDMPLIAYRMIKRHPWIQQALRARFPILFVDEYQDLGHALHELVLKLCFEAGMRLFAVADADQSIYAFTGANPDLLTSFISRSDVQTIRLRFNYRCGTKIIDASMAALGEERGYKAPVGTGEGRIHFHGVDGELADQAQFVVLNLLPNLVAQGIPYDQIAVLYRTADQGSVVATAALAAGVPIVRADNQALVKRNSKLSRFVEASAEWVAGGWRECTPRFGRLVDEAVAIVFGPSSSDDERRAIRLELIAFLKASIDTGGTTHSWLRDLRDTLIVPWRTRTRTPTDEWDSIDEMIRRTDPEGGTEDIPLAHFGGQIAGTGRLNLNTLHSAKGREFDATILFAVNSDVIPTWRDQQRAEVLRETRRLFYVGVTRSRHDLFLVFRKGGYSPWVKELHDRVNSA